MELLLLKEVEGAEARNAAVGLQLLQLGCWMLAVVQSICQRQKLESGTGGLGGLCLPHANLHLL